MKPKISKQDTNLLKQKDLFQYTEKYNKDDINQFTKYIAENYLNNGSKCQIMYNFLQLHDKSTEIILFQRNHPKFHNIMPSGYTFTSIKKDKYFCDDKLCGNNEELIKAKKVYEKSCIDGKPLIFIVVEYPRKDDVKTSDLSYILTNKSPLIK